MILGSIEMVQKSSLGMRASDRQDGMSLPTTRGLKYFCPKGLEKVQGWSQETGMLTLCMHWHTEKLLFPGSR